MISAGKGFGILALLAVLAQPAPAQTGAAKPDDSRFTKTVLDDDLNEPMELEVAPDGRVYYIERTGNVNRYDPLTRKRVRLAKLPVRFMAEDGLMGLALDPGFARNGLLYLYYGDPVPEGGVYCNVLARFTTTGDSLNLSTRTELLRVPLRHEGVSHSGGSLAFDGQGNLYLSTGDNTNPFESAGYSPADDRPGRQDFDALRSAGNTNDLRGKILRIHPEPQGGYSIPAGNLFAPGTPKTRPEIYIMGCRNPYRISVDRPTGILYWGEVGPDAGTDSVGRGPRGYDEFNRAVKAGNFGWPLLIGNGQPYYLPEPGAPAGSPPVPASAARPANPSANNTGLRELPPAQPATLWYPYAQSPEFPALGSGGRNAIGGPVYRQAAHSGAPDRFPAYYEGRWFVADWMRNWVFTIAMDSAGRVQSLEPFLPKESFSKPIDLAFGPEGALYILEYGTYWRAKNADARLVRIDYAEGNRRPVARLRADKTVGAAPLAVRFYAGESFDHDSGDSLRYTWQFTDRPSQATGARAAFTFGKPGRYTVMVTVSDPHGHTATATQTIKVGNEPPQVSIRTSGNRSFYLKRKPLAYRVVVTDREDGTLGKAIPAGRVLVKRQYLPEGYDLAAMDALGEVKPRGLVLLEGSDCGACHARKQQSVGPAYEAIARRYRPDDIRRLAAKVISGGGGSWESGHVMSAHPQLSTDDATEMVRYILSLGGPEKKQPLTGILAADKPTGLHALTARYTDRGGLTGQAAVYLREPVLAAAEAPISWGVSKRNNAAGPPTVAFTQDSAWLCYPRIDLTDLRQASVSVVSPGLEGRIELHLGNPSGLLLAQWPVPDGKNAQFLHSPLLPAKGEHDLYVVYRERAGGISIWKRMEIREISFSD